MVSKKLRKSKARPILSLQDIPEDGIVVDSTAAKDRPCIIAAPPPTAPPPTAPPTTSLPRVPPLTTSPHTTPLPNLVECLSRVHSSALSALSESSIIVHPPSFVSSIDVNARQKSKMQHFSSAMYDLWIEVKSRMKWETNLKGRRENQETKLGEGKRRWGATTARQLMR
ncbi:hypothetical protein NHQ30_010469 [Ciborinia camelliae]|nr:hypothetical protein NHQ30_010469 [Ciborinia camelliae]